MASTAFEEPFSALITYLKGAIKTDEIIRIPAHIEEPFRSASHPTDSTQLRDLLKLFGLKDQHHLLRLAPKAFCGIVFVILHFPYSTSQDKLLHIFLTAFGTLRDESTTLQTLQKSVISNVTRDRVKEARQSISHRLLHALLRRLVSGGIERKQRWLLTRFLSALTDDDGQAVKRLASSPECKHLSTLLHDLDDYVGRVVIANLMRQLIYQGVNPSTFWPPETAGQIILGFPTRPQSSSAWLEDLQRYFAELDTTLAFGAERQSMFCVAQLTRGKHGSNQTAQQAILVVSDAFYFIVPSAEATPLRTLSFPILTRSKMDVSHIGQLDGTTNGILVAYPKEDGFELCDGVKSAVSDMSIFFTNNDDAMVTLDLIFQMQDALRELSGDKFAREEHLQTFMSTPKRSIALLNLWSPDADIQRAVNESSCEESRHGSDTREISPLQNRSRAAFQSNLIGEHSATSGDVSETSFLEAAQDTRALSDRLHASQEAQKHGQTASVFNATVDDVVARHNPSISVLKPAVLGKEADQEGAIVSSPYLPPTKRTVASPASPSRSAVASRNKRAESIAASRQIKGLVGPIVVDSKLLSTQPAAGQKHTVVSIAESDPVPTSATRPKVLEKRPRGPMARLAGSNPAGNKQSSNFESQPSGGLKRKAIPSGKANSSDNLDWDQDLRDEKHLNLPDDESEPERLTKKIQKTAKQPEKTRAARSKAEKGKKERTSKNMKKPFGRPRKAKQEKIPGPVESTVASTRARRARKSAKYAEDSASDDLEEDEQHSGLGTSKNWSSDAGSPLRKRSEQWQAATTLLPKKSDARRRIHSQTLPVTKSKAETGTSGDNSAAPETRAAKAPGHTKSEKSEKPLLPTSTEITSTLDRRGLAAASKSVSVSSERFSMAERDLAAEPSARHDEISDDEAQDSHPMNNVKRDAFAAFNDTSFGTQLQAYIQRSGKNDVADKENIPPAPETPFGNKSQFVVNVNAAKSASSKRIPASQLPKSPDGVILTRRRGAGTQIKPQIRGLSGPGGSAGKKVSDRSTPAALQGEDDAGVIRRANSPEVQDTLQDDFLVGTADGAHNEPVSSRQSRQQVEVAAPPSTALQAVPEGLAVLGDDNVQHTEEQGVETNADRISELVPEHSILAKDHSAARNAVASEAPGVENLKAMTQSANHSKQLASARGLESNTISKGVSAAGGSSKTVASRKTFSSSTTTNTKSTQASHKATAVTKKAKLIEPEVSSLDAVQSIGYGPTTPAPKLNAVTGPLTIVKLAKKPTLVQFSSAGPVNQGVSRRSAGIVSPEASIPQPETVKHAEAKGQTSLERRTETPSHRPDVIIQRPPSCYSETQSEAAEEGIVVEDEVCVASEPRTFSAARGHGPNIGQIDQDHPMTCPAISSITNQRAAPQQHLVRQPSAESIYSGDGVGVHVEEIISSDTEDGVASEYDDNSGSTEESQESERRRDGTSKSGLQVPAAPKTPELDEIPAQQSASRRPTKAALMGSSQSRESIGLGEIVDTIHGGAGHKINVEPLRTQTLPRSNTTNMNMSLSIGEDLLPAGAVKEAHRVSDDEARMPPPATKKRQSMNGVGRAQIFGGSTTQQASLADMKNRFASPGVDTRPAPDLTPNGPVSHPSEIDEYHQRANNAHIRVLRRGELTQTPEPVPPPGTPVPFHSTLAIHFQQAHLPERGNRESYVSDNTGDTTLVFANPQSAPGLQHAWDGKRHVREMSETNDETSDSEKRDFVAYNGASRPSHSDLIKAVLQISNDVLLRFGEEEDGVVAKASDYEGGGGVALGKLSSSWNDRFLHESEKVSATVTQTKQGLEKMLGSVKSDDEPGVKGTPHTARLANLARTVMARGAELLEAMETIEETQV